MFFLYKILTNFFYPFFVIIIWLRKFLKKEHSLRYKEKIFASYFNVKRNKDSKLIWFHAASVGEVKSILPIIDKLNQTQLKINFLLTTVTLSSANLAGEELKGIKNIQHRFFPLDISFLIKKFLKSWSPDAIFLVDSEIWPNLIMSARENKIPISIINARITSKTFKRWKLFPKTAEKIFNSFDLCLSSNQETMEFLSHFKMKNIFYTGNIKLVSKTSQFKIKNVNQKFLSENKFWLAASTHKGEEIFCLKTHLKIKENHKNIITIIAPRHINRILEIKKKCDNFNLTSQILNKDDLILENKEIILINSFGVLPSFFNYAKSVFVGKSLIESLKQEGGQSPIEAAKLGCFIYHGKYVYNFQEIYKILHQNNISKEISSYDELANLIIKDFMKTKEKEKSLKLFNDLGEKIFSETMKQINNFLSNGVK